MKKKYEKSVVLESIGLQREYNYNQALNSPPPAPLEPRSCLDAEFMQNMNMPNKYRSNIIRDI